MSGMEHLSFQMVHKTATERISQNTIAYFKDSCKVLLSVKSSRSSWKLPGIGKVTLILLHRPPNLCAFGQEKNIWFWFSSAILHKQHHWDSKFSKVAFSASMDVNPQDIIKGWMYIFSFTKKLYIFFYYQRDAYIISFKSIALSLFL